MIHASCEKHAIVHKNTKFLPPEKKSRKLELGTIQKENA